ncbi:DUF6223 family protein [Streptomyces sp. NPDC059897]|uniref:DUF6223 family protein n=1 Tax=Streptomyces sp. NPDC059897 TaxID=3346994 RepID=UPI003648AFC3
MSGLMSVRSALASARAAEVDSTALTADRVWATSAALLGLVGVILAALALARADRRYALVAQAAGLVAVVIGVLNLALADGGPGTGNGVVGGGIALVLGVAAAVVGRLAQRRSRRDGAARHQPVR